MKLGSEGGGFLHFVADESISQSPPMGSLTSTVIGASLWLRRRDFEFHFLDVGGDLLVVGLFAFGDDVEGVADVHLDVFVFGSVVDAVFADEEHAAL